VVAGFEANSNRYIVDYLIDDVLDQQPPGVQQFLLCTSILTRFCPALCAAVLASAETVAQQHIHHLARENLFLIELSTPVHWHRYHHQFQSMLLSRLHERYDPQAIAMLHRQAAAWLAAHGQVDEALRHLAAVPDFDAVADLIESQRVAVLNEQRFHDLEAWLNFVSEPMQNQRPALLIGQAWVQFDHHDNAQCLATTQRAAARLDEQATTFPAATLQLLQAELVAMRTSLDRSLDETERLGLIQQSWTGLVPSLVLAHCNVPLQFAATCQRLGELELALAIVLTTHEETPLWPPVGRCSLLHRAGFFYWCDGNLAQAERTFQENLCLSRQHALPLIATISQHGLGAIADARNQPELAETYYLESVKDPHLSNGQDVVMDLYSLIGICARRGQPEAARPLVERLKSYARRIGRAHLLNQVAALEAYLALYCGDLGEAVRWALAGSRREMENGANRVPVIRAQILLADGSPASLQEASQLLLALSLRHKSEHSWYRPTEIEILQALIWAKLGQMESALAVLGEAVQTAVPKGMIGLFIAQGQPLVRLLYELGKQPAYTQLVQLLLAAFRSDRTPSALTLPAVALPEPLTEREIEVLRLLAARLSNKEIAHHLIVSVHTVRNHTVNIFGKLQVDNRIQAVERARALGLLSIPERQRE
jgi:LuxR family maltose regulon positive regulatory protein